MVPHSMAWTLKNLVRRGGAHGFRLRLSPRATVEQGTDDQAQYVAKDCVSEGPAVGRRASEQEADPVSETAPGMPRRQELARNLNRSLIIHLPAGMTLQPHNGKNTSHEGASSVPRTLFPCGKITRCDRRSLPSSGGSVRRRVGADPPAPPSGVKQNPHQLAGRNAGKRISSISPPYTRTPGQLFFSHTCSSSCDSNSATSMRLRWSALRSQRYSRAQFLLVHLPHPQDSVPRSVTRVHSPTRLRADFATSLLKRASLECQLNNNQFMIVFLVCDFSQGRKC